MTKTHTMLAAVFRARFDHADLVAKTTGQDGALAATIIMQLAQDVADVLDHEGGFNRRLWLDAAGVRSKDTWTEARK